LLYCSLDIETSGLDPNNNQILEIGAVLDNGGPLDRLPTFSRAIYWPMITGSPVALHMNRRLLHTRGDSLTTVLNRLRQFLGDRSVTFAGKNFGSFDYQFLRQHSEWAHIRHSYRFLDVGSMFWLPADEEVPDLQECLNRARIDHKINHVAVDDAMAVVKLIRWKHGITI